MASLSISEVCKSHCWAITGPVPSSEKPKEENPTVHGPYLEPMTSNFRALSVIKAKYIKFPVLMLLLLSLLSLKSLPINDTG